MKIIIKKLSILTISILSIIIFATIGFGKSVLAMESNSKQNSPNFIREQFNSNIELIHSKFIHLYKQLYGKCAHIEDDKNDNITEFIEKISPDTILLINKIKNIQNTYNMHTNTIKEEARKNKKVPKYSKLNKLYQQKIDFLNWEILNMKDTFELFIDTLNKKSDSPTYIGKKIKRESKHKKILVG